MAQEARKFSLRFSFFWLHVFTTYKSIAIKSEYFQNKCVFISRTRREMPKMILNMFRMQFVFWKNAHTHTHIYTKLAWARKRTPQKKLELNTRRIQRPMKFKQLFAEKSLECKTIKQHHFTSFNAHHYFPFALCALQGRICFRFAFFSAIIKSNQQTQTKEYEQVIVYKYKTDGGMWVWMGAIALKLEVPRGNDNTSSLNSYLERFSALSIGKRSNSHWIKLQLTFAACYPPFALLLWAAYLYCYKMISLKFIKRHENNIYSNIHIAYTRIA